VKFDELAGVVGPEQRRTAGGATQATRLFGRAPAAGRTAPRDLRGRIGREGVERCAVAAAAGHAMAQADVQRLAARLEAQRATGAAAVA
jgi:hypothetical protein